MSNELSVGNIYNNLHDRVGLTWLAGKVAHKNKIDVTRAREGGASLLGHLNLIHPNQIQLLGRIEINYINSLNEEERQEVMQHLFSSQTLAIIIGEDLPAPTGFTTLADREKIALMNSPMSSFDLILELRHLFSQVLADETIIHGVYLEVKGIGVLLVGEAGVGKSELALELINRGHSLIADDAPIFSRISPQIISGNCPALLQDFLEVRGLGILNIRSMYGSSAVKQSKYLRLIIRMEPYEKLEKSPLDRLLGIRKMVNVLGLEIPEVTIPVAPGRSLSVLVEAAASNHILLINGYNSAEDFRKQQRKQIKKNS